MSWKFNQIQDFVAVDTEQGRIRLNFMYVREVQTRINPETGQEEEVLRRDGQPSMRPIGTIGELVFENGEKLVYSARLHPNDTFSYSGGRRAAIFGVIKQAYPDNRDMRKRLADAFISRESELRERSRLPRKEVDVSQP